MELLTLLLLFKATTVLPPFGRCWHEGLGCSGRSRSRSWTAGRVPPLSHTHRPGPGILLAIITIALLISGCDQMLPLFPFLTRPPGASRVTFLEHKAGSDPELKPVEADQSARKAPSSPAGLPHVTTHLLHLCSLQGFAHQHPVFCFPGTGGRASVSRASAPGQCVVGTGSALGG